MGSGEKGESDGWLVCAVRGRAVCGRGERERRVGPVGRAGAGTGVLVREASRVGLCAGRVVKSCGMVGGCANLLLSDLYLLDEARDLRPLLPVSDSDLRF